MAQKDHEDDLNTRATINMYIILKGKKKSQQKKHSLTLDGVQEQLISLGSEIQ